MILRYAYQEKKEYFLQKKAYSRRCYCKLSHNSVFSTGSQGLQGNIPPPKTISAQIAGTQSTQWNS